MITVLHMTVETMPREVYLNLTVPCEEHIRSARARAALAAGHYEVVARVDSDDLEHAWMVTNNIDSSWSLDPWPTVEVSKPLPTIKGRAYGHRSSMVGDVFVLNGSVHVVDSFGFTAMPEVMVG